MPFLLHDRYRSKKQHSAIQRARREKRIEFEWEGRKKKFSFFFRFSHFYFAFFSPLGSCTCVLFCEGRWPSRRLLTSLDVLWRVNGQGRKFWWDDEETERERKESWVGGELANICSVFSIGVVIAVIALQPPCVVREGRCCKRGEELHVPATRSHW